jgi:hypothetical protein
MPTPRRTVPVPSPAARKDSAAAQIDSFIAKFDAPMASLIRAARRALRRRFPTAIEQVYDNYNFFVIGYCSTMQTSSCIVSLAAAANGVSLSFYYGATLPDPTHILQGSGKQNRFIRLPSAAKIAEPAVEALIRSAIAQADPPLSSTGRGSTVIKSISAKQRPRRA